MRPFQASYYIKSNKPRAIALVCMIASILIIYLGGVYISSFDNMTEYLYQQYDEYTFVFNNYGSTQENYDKTIEDFKNSTNIGLVVPVNSIMWFNVLNELSIKNSVSIITFAIPEDATDFFSFMYPTQDIHISDGQLAISSKLAKNLRLQVGDRINKDSTAANRLDREYEIVQIVESEDFFAFGVDKGQANTYMVSRNEGVGKEKGQAKKEFLDFIKNYTKDNNKVTIRTFDSIKEEVTQQLKAMDLLFYGIIILLIVILSVAVNATFLGAYEKRQYEYSVYKAIGFSKFEIGYKIVKEVMLINLLGVCMATAVALGVIWLVNETVYNPMGLGLQYFNLKALISTLICDILVIFPVVWFRVRKIRKYDITEY